MKTELHNTASVFDDLSGEWNQLLSPERTTDFFMTLEWQRIWWKHLGRGDLSVVAVRDDSGTLLGVAPWFIETLDGQRSVQTIGCRDVSDYLTLLLRPGRENEAVEKILDFMLSSDAPLWDRLNLCNVPEESLTCTLLPAAAQRRGLSVEVVLEDVCPVIPLPESYEAYLEGLDKKQRHELRRKRRRAEEYGADFYVVGPDRDLDDEIGAFLDLMAMSTTSKAAFLDAPGHRDFFREVGQVLMRAGWLRLIFLTVEGQRAATMWQFAYHRRMLLYNSGLNPHIFSALSPGIVLLTYSIEDAIGHGCRIYDFLQGDEEYKYRMGAISTAVHNVIIRRG